MSHNKSRTHSRISLDNKDVKTVTYARTTELELNGSMFGPFHASKCLLLCEKARENISNDIMSELKVGFHAGFKKLAASDAEIVKRLTSLGCVDSCSDY